MGAVLKEDDTLVVTEDTTMGGSFLTTLLAVAEMLRCSQAFVKRAKN